LTKLAAFQINHNGLVVSEVFSMLVNELVKIVSLKALDNSNPP
jgi:hypothetical protein